ncbi:MAG: UTP--glucose-1-phosphate uridylyltransferase GalU [Bacteroidetes bacterium]|nr:UTP--glucose-1-phosphate uridylyltransferase GalU [Bacteroidota bacterium]MBT4400073.1 UTP--glucose-1-phosphate uridylyltransferase GalU [Bacteroidota bacterium]MBT7093690.1 UTP--glucose-1-phosphate uridylyltransferase GalU [Bacteroidota bacterium]MBT7466405.1 UTP--glucose-1-phosphate uridylyltransferase GalU [Bacteroidota bacterium]
MIKKAIIPAAGFGTRFLPATKSQPKEMLPVVDKPTIQYVVEEAVESGITDILMIIGRGKRAIEEHFDRSFELEIQLEEKEKFDELLAIRKISRMADIHFIWQKELNGLGDAVRYARLHVGNQPFAILLGDTIMESDEKPVLKQLMDVHEIYGGSVVALEEVPDEKVSRYGVMDGKETAKNIYAVNTFIEKPSLEQAPSNLVIASRYILDSAIFDCLDNVFPGVNNEIQLTDAMKLLLETQKMYGLKFEGKRHDIGNKLDFIKTSVLFGLRNSDISIELKKWIWEIGDSI